MPKQPQSRTESLKHHEERLEQMRSASLTRQQEMSVEEEKRKLVAAEHEQQAREDAIALTTQYGALADQPDTREMLLDHIRRLRNEKPPEIVPIGRNAAMQAQFEAEQEAGRRAVAKAEAEAELNRQRREQYEAAERAKTAQLTPVHRENPGQNEVFPTSKATLK
jgi:hypothetical protein